MLKETSNVAELKEFCRGQQRAVITTSKVLITYNLQLQQVFHIQPDEFE